MALAAPSFRKKKQKYPFLFCSLLTYSYLCNCMNPTNIDEPIVEYEKPYEDDGSLLIAAESSWRGMAVELQELHYLRGAQFINQLKLIVYYGDFHPVEGETNIYSAISPQDADYDNLINAARKAVEHGYRVYLLPNPKGIRTADFIFERKGIYKMFDLKTITGKSSAGTRLMESIGQTNHVILNLTSNYEPRQLAKDVKIYFEANQEAREVLVLKGSKFLSISRRFVEGKDFFKMFMKRFLR
jgi:hypothetical protein